MVFRGYIGGLERHEVVARARGLLGERWDVLANKWKPNEVGTARVVEE